MSKLSFYIVGLLVLLGLGTARSQPLFPIEGIAFEDLAVSRVDVFLDQDSLDVLLAPGNEESYHEYAAQFIFSHSAGVDTVDNVGFRLRGNTSRYSAKKSFKVAFNSFDNQNFERLDKMNLNGEHNDPSIARSKICWDLCRDFLVPASRCNPVELYINSEYKGLYVNVEHIDDEFVKIRFGNSDGNLYKCLYPADLNYKGNNPDLYKEEYWGTRAYDLRTNTDADDYSDLANFIDILNNTSLASLPEELEQVFNVAGFLRYYAVEVFTGHWDGYAYNKNNFYLYNDPETELFHFIPYDLDNTLGIDWMGRDWANRDVNDWPSHGEYRPLVERLMQVDEYKDWFNFYFEKLLDEVAQTSVIFPKIDSYRALVITSVYEDPYHSMDYGYSYSDFYNAFTQAQGDHVTYGIKPYITERVTTGYQQLETNDIHPIISYVRTNHPGPNQEVNITARVEDEDVPTVTLFYKSGQGAWVSRVMSDLGQTNDWESSDGLFGVNLEPFSGGDTVYYYIEASDIGGKTSRYPRSGEKILTVENYADVSLVINEFMAKNTTTAEDQNGNFDDWIEIYNPGTSAVYLGDKYLSDNSDNPSKWQFPAVSLEAGAYYIVWADKEEAEGDNHANFKLSGNGEEILLVDSDGSTLIDYLKYYPQSTDVSEGRYPNGSGPTQLLGVATPGAANALVGVEELEPIANLNVYPNPFKDRCTIQCAELQNKKINCEFYSMDGSLLKTMTSSATEIIWDGCNDLGMELPSGLYFVRMTNAVGTIVASRKIVKL